jgi:hypothetical protein
MPLMRLPIRPLSNLCFTEIPMATNPISMPVVRSVSFAQQEQCLCIAEPEDAARLFYTLLKDEHEVEKVFGEFLVSVTPLQ